MACSREINDCDLSTKVKLLDGVYTWMGDCLAIPLLYAMESQDACLSNASSMDKQEIEHTLLVIDYHKVCAYVQGWP